MVFSLKNSIFKHDTLYKKKKLNTLMNCISQQVTGISAHVS